MNSRFHRALTVGLIAVLAGCGTTIKEPPRPPAYRPLSATEGRAMIARLLPDGVRDRAGWATDFYAAFAALDIPPTLENICSTIAITGQESSFQADPVVPGLAGIARKEIDKRRESAGIPKFALDAALAISSTNGKSYGERLDAVKTELQLSEIYEDFIGRVPFGKSLLADRNPVRTGGPMQVSIAFAETLAAAKPYPYPVAGTIRHEVFTRRGGVYFGIAHLLDYPAPYARPLYRFADFNAGQYASRNAAFQSALTQLSGIPLELDGDLLRYDHGQPAREPGSTELATRVLARRIDMGNEDIRRDLDRGKGQGFEQTRLYTRVFGLADKLADMPAPRAVVPKIALQSPKITRELTTDWFANRVEGRYQACLQRSAA
ncbi:MAG: DUF1615 domain-containing protein [Betaproteobacteria bacterium]